MEGFSVAMVKEYGAQIAENVVVCTQDQKCGPSTVKKRALELQWQCKSRGALKR
jgi:hypothetical protein